jgi:hypothetical protein
MVKVSTLFHRVDGFDESGTSFNGTDKMDQVLGDNFLEELLGPLEFDPGDKLVNAILKQI